MKLSSEQHIDTLISGEKQLIAFTPENGWGYTAPAPLTVLAGSFRPLHWGHRTLLLRAAELNRNVGASAFEVSVRNVEKPSLSKDSVLNCIAQFDTETDTLIVTSAATFVEKARLMPGAVFVIGYDTAVRLFDDQFYQSSDSASASLDAIAEMRELGCSFIVGGRHDEKGVFRTTADIQAPRWAMNLLRQIPESRFSESISSTAIRQSTMSNRSDHI